MAGYVLYFPGPPAPLAERFPACQASDLLDQTPQWQPVAPGPDGGAGMLATWPSENRRSGTARELVAIHTWHPCRPNKRTGLGKGAYWIGLDRTRPVRPDDLARCKLHPGYVVRLADGQHWQIPSAAGLPHIVALDEAGGVLAHRAAPRDLVGMELACACSERPGLAPATAHLADRPREVDRGRACREKRRRAKKNDLWLLKRAEENAAASGPKAPAKTAT